MFIQFRKVWKCQTDNKNPSTELGQTVKWPKGDKETTIVHRIIHIIPWILLKIEYEASWSGKVSVFCSTWGNHHRFTCFLYPFVPYIYCYYDFRIKKCSVRLFLQLFVGGYIFYLHNLCLLPYSGMFFLSVFVLCPVASFFWIVQFFIAPAVFSNVY